MSFETLIGWRYLRARRKQKFISVISMFSLFGVALGVTALIVVIGVMTGFEEEMRQKILGVNSHVMLLRFGQPMSEYRDLRPRILKIDGVRSVDPFIYTQVLISGRGGVSGAVLRGVDPKLTAQGGHLARTITVGGLDELEPPGSSPEHPAHTVLLGTELAQKLGAAPGDSVRVVSPVGSPALEGGRQPRSRVLKVVGLFETGMYDYDANLAYISLAQAQEFLNLGDTVTGLEIKVDDIYQADKIRGAVLAEAGPSYWARDWMQMNRNIFAALKLQKTVLFIILTLTILVAAFNIVSTLIMVVMEKTKDIAILKSMGATRRSVTKIFVLQGLLVGVGGTAAGFALGLVLCELLARYQFIKLSSDVYYITTLPVRLDALSVVLIAFAAVFISFVATLYPSWQAGRLNPVEALRY